MTIYINKEPLDPAQVDAEMQRMRPQFEQAFSEESPEEREKKLREWAEENIVERVLLMQAALRDCDPVPPEQVEALWEQAVGQAGSSEELIKRSGMESEAAIREDMEKHLRLDAFMKELLEKAPEMTDEEVRAFFEKHPEMFTQPETVHAAHIVKHLNPDSDRDALMEEMHSVRKKLRNNGYFPEIATEHSDCPDNGGDLGVFPRGQMVPAFEEVVFNLNPGETSDIFETEFGFHIATVMEKNEASVADFDTYREQIAEHARKWHQQKVVEDFVDGEKAKATIERKD